MIAVIQRVNKAKVISDGTLTGDIDKGLYILLGVGKEDTEEDARLLSEKIAKLRIFSDINGKMNLSIKDIDGDILVVSNFTLLANYSHGNRPDYFGAASPDIANSLYQHFVNLISKEVKKCMTGVFGADMKTEMETDGPVTIVMDSKVLKKKG